MFPDGRNLPISIFQGPFPPSPTLSYPLNQFSLVKWLMIQTIFITLSNLQCSTEMSPTLHKLVGDTQTIQFQER